MTSTLLKYRGRGLTSRQDVTVTVQKGKSGSGITFSIANPNKEGEFVTVAARAENVVNTMRNVVLGKEGVRLCIVEHFMAAAALWGLNDLSVEVCGPEMPLGDGSANFWLDLFRRAGLEREVQTADIELPEPIILNKKDRSLIALPDEKFSITYMMDWDHPRIGKRWQTWDASMDPSQIADARTFGPLKEHEVLGLQNDVVSLTHDGFTFALRYEDEPVRHKLLDLLGDLALSGVNPLRFKARFISIKGGHELDVALAKKLSALV